MDLGNRSLWFKLAFSLCALLILVVYLQVTGEQPSGLVTGTTTVNISQETVLILNVSSLDFGTIVLNSTQNTEADNPVPFILINDGNVLLDISVRTNQSIFTGTGAGNNTNSFQFKAATCSAANCVTEPVNAFDSSNSLITYTNFTTVDQKVIDSLEIVSPNDRAEIEVQLQVPVDESVGAKTAQILFTATKES